MATDIPGVFSRVGLMPVLPPVPYARQTLLWALACVVPLLIITSIFELAPRKPITAPLVKTVERHPVQQGEPISVPGEPVLTFEERWAPVQSQWGESRKPFMALPAPVVPITRSAAPAEPEAAPATPSRKTERRLAQQEVCATHGLRKVWVSRWRWRCQH